MTERTAGEILLAQLEYDVLEAKRAVQEDPSSEAIENLCTRVVQRWWLSRMVHEPEKPQDAQELQNRQRERAQSYALCAQIIKARSGPIDPESLQVSVLGLSAEINAIWAVLIDSALVTQNDRHNYMDGSAAELYGRVQGMASKIVMPGSNGSKLAT
jgi:hypothetical protein